MSHKIKDYLIIIIGSAIGGFSVACFITPAKIAAGGINGIGTIVYYLWGLDTGVTMFLISVPLFFVGVKIFGPLYGFKSLLGTFLFAMFVTIFGQMTQYQGFLDYTDKVDVLLSGIIGGALLGGGIGLVMKTGSNTGGTDIVAQILAHYSRIPLGTSLFLVDGLVVLAGGTVFGLESALIAIFTLYISGQAVNYVVMNMGTKYAKTAYIVSCSVDTISDRIIKELHKGGTIIEGKGIYTQKSRNLLMVVVPNHLINQLINIVHEEDENAFLFVHETYQVLGFGFVPLSKMATK